MNENPPKVNKWDGNAVKNALDDAVKDVLLTQYNYIESHKLLDGRLLISTVAVGFSLFAILYDFLYPFPQSKMILMICVLSYFLMMGVLTWYTSFVEQGIFCTVLDRDAAGLDPDNLWNVSSNLKRFDSNYSLSLKYQCGKSGKEKEASSVMPIEKYFDESGKLLYNKVVDFVLQLHSDIDHKKN